MRRAVTATAVMVLVAAAFGGGGEAAGCTGFFINRPNVRVMAVNYDWDVGGGRLIANQRGVLKSALVPEGAQPLTWVSSYGSLTLNQYGREFPIGGINQMGLAMQVLWLDDTVWPTRAQGPAVGALQWVQYCLDTFASVGQVVDSARQLTISSPAKLHFLACGRNGSCAVVEFLDGEPVIRAGDQLPLPVLANSTYVESIAALDAKLGYGGTVVPTQGEASLSRFTRAATQLHRINLTSTEPAIDRAFDMLADLAIESQNQWRVVYDLRSQSVHFTTRSNPHRRSLSIEEVDLDCAPDSVLSVDLADKGSGSVVEKLEPLTASENLELVKASVAGTEFLEESSAQEVLRWGRYSETLSCAAPPVRQKPSSPFGPDGAPKD